jgi:hypothetical protein
VKPPRGDAKGYSFAATDFGRALKAAREVGGLLVLILILQIIFPRTKLIALSVLPSAPDS